MKASAWKETLFADRGRGFGEFLRRLLAGIPWSDRAETAETLTFARPRQLLRVDNAHGRVRVVGEKRDDLQVRARKVARAESEAAARALAAAIRVAASRTGSTLSLSAEVPRRWHRTGQLHLEIRVPSDLRIEISTACGRVAVEGLRAPLRVHSDHGAVCVLDVKGDVEIETSGARVSCCAVEGHVVARSANGKVQLERHRGSIDAATCNGAIHARLEALGPGGVELATSNGRILLELPDPADADLDLRIDNGLIRSQRALEPCTRRTPSRLVGRVGRGGIPVRVCATNGSISVR